MYINSCLAFIVSWITTDLVQGAQFKLHHMETATWDSAKAICEERGHVFARVPTDENMAMVQRLRPYTNG
ncbi:hypothetical protein PoB_003462200 [Plakobranchus ocellatus]|uniref:C-type lectin domain-containing protein n=1 Tax=Plakobranchus ocellatus TaxID=259542 RepID=A0AAV4AMB4_9GAST|nr:hypothetical protein PoB_003462200 [Plakobranchus ocellatus]